MDTWKNIVTALVNVEPNPVTGRVTENEIVWILAEMGGIVPAETAEGIPYEEIL
jgi:hypothetical protein